MHLIKVTLKGSDMSRLIREMEKSRQFLRKFPIRGMGFRGKILANYVMMGFVLSQIARPFFGKGNLFSQSRSIR